MSGPTRRAESPRLGSHRPRSKRRSRRNQTPRLDAYSDRACSGRRGPHIVRSPMHVTMIKKRLANGQPCEKCVQAEELLKRRGLWQRIDEVVWADESDPESPGMKLAKEKSVALAPFFIVKEGSSE